MLPTIAGTPQAQAASNENAIAQTATIPLKNGPTFKPDFDGAPQYTPIAGHVAALRRQRRRADHPGRAQ